ncbi:PREDICTED: putative protein TPRXL isoform X2 [Ipomoea nil]|uniref:putative protein TPRXL isoform X2 n=1 Tax=Ipomoea nil TaxID=35883 RepID=UPI000901DE83|nr:PREDICTED: putative protein TPRXL isoform X2 [Ipomoea nil]
MTDHVLLAWTKMVEDQENTMHSLRNDLDQAEKVLVGWQSKLCKLIRTESLLKDANNLLNDANNLLNGIVDSPGGSDTRALAIRGVSVSDSVLYIDSHGVSHTDSPAVSHTEDSPAVSHTEDSPAVSHTEDSPAVSHTEDSPAVSHTEDSPAVSHTEDSPAVSHTEDSPAVSHTEDSPAVSHTEDSPAVSHTEDIPAVSHTKDIPALSHTHDSKGGFELSPLPTTPSTPELCGKADDLKQRDQKVNECIIEMEASLKVTKERIAAWENAARILRRVNILVRHALDGVSSTVDMLRDISQQADVNA